MLKVSLLISIVYVTTLFLSGVFWGPQIKDEMIEMKSGSIMIGLIQRPLDDQAYMSSHI